jgi:hypothetical protein
MLVTSAIDQQAWEHGNMWHVAGGGCLYKFILNCTINLEVDLFSAWGQADMVTLLKPLLGYVSILVFVTIDFFQRVLVYWWNAYEYKEFAGDSSEFKCAWD